LIEYLVHVGISAGNRSEGLIFSRYSGFLIRSGNRFGLFCSLRYT
jgi:hypothetical protein